MNEVATPAWIALRGVGAFVATFIASWWLIGDQSEAAIGPYQLDYIVQAPDVPDAAVAGVGVVCLVVTIAIALTLIVRHTRSGARRELRIVAALAAAGFVLAGIARVETAGSHGANIGGGLAVFFGGPIVVFLFAYALREFRKTNPPKHARSGGDAR
jgi:hypothetical protein